MQSTFLNVSYSYFHVFAFCWCCNTSNESNLWNVCKCIRKVRANKQTKEQSKITINLNSQDWAPGSWNYNSIIILQGQQLIFNLVIHHNKLEIINLQRFQHYLDLILTDNWYLVCWNTTISFPTRSENKNVFYQNSFTLGTVSE